MPSANTDSLEVKIDSVFFNVGKDYLSAIISTKRLSKPFVSGRINAIMDLERLDQAIGLTDVDLKGKWEMNIKADGLYDISKKSFPATNGTINISNGYIKTSYYPQPITNISLAAKINNATGAMKDLNVSVHPFLFEFEKILLLLMPI